MEPSAHKRPLSAIFLGNSTTGAPASLSLHTQQTPDGGSGLPSPPATNSTASTGKESLPKRVRKTSIAFATVKSMLTGERRQRDLDRRKQEDEELVEDEDHTARLSGPAASTSSDGSLMLGRSSIGARSASSGGVDRVRSLADRNRMVLDKLSSISSAASSRLNSPAPADRVPLTASTLRSRNVSPLPPLSANTLFPPKSNTSATGSSPRGAYATLSPSGRQARDIEPDTPSSRISPSDSAASSARGSDQPLTRASIIGRQASVRESPRTREIEFTPEYEESTTPKERERLYEQQRAPVFSVSGDGNTSGVARQGSVRVSFSRTRPEMDVDEFGMSGTSRPRERVYSSESDDRSITPPADASRRYTDPTPPTSGGRHRRVSINEPDTSPTKAREPLRTRAAAGTIGRQRNSAEIIERTVAAARKSPVRSRGALPSEFRSSMDGKRASFDNKRFSLDGKRTYSRSSNSPELPRRDTAQRATTISATTRAATVRESSRRTHSRWASEDVSADGTDASDRPRPRYERRGGSIESPITPGGRSVVGETFKAAGLTKRRDPEPPSATHSRSGTRESIDWEIEELRNGIARVGVGDGIHEEEDDEEYQREPSLTPDNKRVGSRVVQNIVTSRPGTSQDEYVEEGPRTAPPVLRPYRSMNTGLMTPSGSGTVRAERGATPVTPAMLVSAASTEHLRLMLESFAMFESNLARADGGTGAVTELLQNADVVVQASQRLNTLLRESAARALQEQIESEVEDRDTREMEIWKVAGTEFRDALKVCDELVRSMTNFLLGVGRIVKERDGEDSTRSSGRISSSEIRSGRVSAEGLRSGRMSADGIRSGRMSAEGLRRVGESRILDEGRRAEIRRSLDTGDSVWKMTSREAPRLHDPMRPSTSMSLLRERERGRVSPIDTNPVRPATSARRFFPTQSSGGGDTSFGTDSYQTPSPASRHLPSNVEHPRERILSIPPSLETVPSESIVRKSDAKTPSITRRPRMSVGTVRGAVPPFPTSAPAPAPTQLSTATATGNGSPEKTQRSISYTVSRSGGAATVSAMSGLQAQARKRTISAADPIEPEMSSPTEMSDSAKQRLQSTMTRTRASMDFSRDSPTLSGSEQRTRRRPATELFT